LGGGALQPGTSLPGIPRAAHTLRHEAPRIGCKLGISEPTILKRAAHFGLLGSRSSRHSESDSPVPVFNVGDYVRQRFHNGGLQLGTVKHIDARYVHVTFDESFPGRPDDIRFRRTDVRLERLS